MECCFPVAAIVIWASVGWRLMEAGYRRTASVLLGILFCGLGAATAVLGAALLMFVLWGIEDVPAGGGVLPLIGGVVGLAVGLIGTRTILRRNDPNRIREQQERAADYDDEASRSPDETDGPTDAGR